MKVIILAMALMLSACSATIPSFYDDNESLLVTEAVWNVRKMDCSSELAYNVSVPKLNSLDKFQLYLELKGSDDLLPAVEKVNKLSRFDYRSESYCNLKKRILVEATNSMASMVFTRIDL